MMPDRTAHITRAARDVTFALAKMRRMWLPTVCRLKAELIADLLVGKSFSYKPNDA